MDISIKDVAKKAGVSIATVSKAFNDYPDVSTNTKEKILKVAKNLGYTPNISASNLSSKSKINMAIIFSHVLNYKSEYSMKLLYGAYKYAMENKLEIATYTIDSNIQKEKSFDLFCKEHHLSGALLFGLKTTDVYCNTLPSSKTPYVTVDIKIPGKNASSVLTDNVSAFRELTQYLINKNHRKFVIVHGRKSAVVSVERLAGAYEAFYNNNIQLTRNRVLYSDFDEDIAYDEVTNYLKTHEKKYVTAFLCMSDLTAIGTINAIKDMGYQVPDDFSVVGFDGLSVTEYTSPKITTVNQNIELKGYEAVKILYKMITKECKGKNILIPHKLISRSSDKEIIL